MHPTEQFLHALVEANQHLEWDAAYLDELRCSINQQHQLTLKSINIKILPPELGLLQNLRQLSLHAVCLGTLGTLWVLGSSMMFFALCSMLFHAQDSP